MVYDLPRKPGKSYLPQPGRITRVAIPKASSARTAGDNRAHRRSPRTGEESAGNPDMVVAGKMTTHAVDSHLPPQRTTTHLCSVPETSPSSCPSYRLLRPVRGNLVLVYIWPVHGYLSRSPCLNLDQLGSWATRSCQFPPLERRAVERRRNPATGQQPICPSLIARPLLSSHTPITMTTLPHRSIHAPRPNDADASEQTQP